MSDITYHIADTDTTYHISHITYHVSRITSQIFASFYQVCDLLVVMFVLGNPLHNFVYDVGCFQSYVFLFTVFQTIPYLCVHMLVRTLSNPYSRF